MKQTQIDQINNDIKGSGFTKISLSLQISSNRNLVYNFLKAKKMNVETLKAIYKIINKDFKKVL